MQTLDDGDDMQEYQTAPNISVPKGSPEQMLWAAVIAQALIDVAIEIPELDTNGLTKKQIAWLMERRREDTKAKKSASIWWRYENFLTVCDYAGFDYSAIQKKLRGKRGS